MVAHLLSRSGLLIGFLYLLCFAHNVHQAESANILFFFGVSSYSHRVPAWPLVEALAEKGHNVTFLSPYPAKRPNPKVFDYVPTKLKEWVDNWGDLEDVFKDRKAGDLVKGWFLLPEFGFMMCEVVYQDEDFLKWVATSKFDLVVIDSLFNDCAYGMAHKFGAKTMLFDTTAVFSWYTEPFGLADETSAIPQMELFYPFDMTFMQRLKNALVPVGWQYLRNWRYFSKLETLTKEKLNLPNLPSFEELERNTSLVLVNSHYGEEFARSLPPNFVSVGGIAWSEKRKPLPKEMEDFINKGNGFIYVSFGTYADFQRLDVDTQQAFIGAFRSFPKIQFVWKVGNASLAAEFPDRNVYIDKWMPQQDILAHPKIRAFMTHSGLIGIQEAIYSSVPLISFPIFAEQDYNAERVHRKQYGIRLEIITVTQPEIEDAISKILEDPKYRNNMVKLSRVFKDRPEKPLETALWWTEYVLRHNEEDLAVLRSPSSRQPWWIRRQLDVWFTLFGAILISVTISLFVLLKTVKFICSSKSNSGVTQKDKRKKVQ